MAGNETSVQDIDEDGNDKKLNLSLGDSNIKGMETEGNDNKDIAQKNRYSRVKEENDTYNSAK